MCMMVRWMCGMLPRNRKWRICSPGGFVVFCVFQSVVDVTRHGRLRWFGHLECRSVDDLVLACRNVEVAGGRSVGAGRLGENVLMMK